MAIDRTLLSIGLLTSALATSLGCIGPQDPARVSETAVDSNPTPLTVNVIEVALSEEVFDTHTCFGTVKPKRSSYLAFARGGQIAEIFKDVGNRVEANEKLAILQQQDLLDQQTELDEAIASAEERLERLNPNNRSSNVQREISRLRQEVDSLNQKRQEIDREIDSRTILAPYDGIIAERKANVGNQVPRGNPILKIVAGDAPIVELQVASRVAEQIEVGELLSVEHQDRAIAATVSSKSPELSPSSHTQLITLEISDTDPNVDWVFGSTVEAQFRTNSNATGFWLPLSALQREADGLWSALVVEQDDDRQLVRRRVLELLQLADDHALVQGSLENGDLVIVNGSNRVVPGQRVAASTLAYSFEQPGPRLSE